MSLSRARFAASLFVLCMLTILGGCEADEVTNVSLTEPVTTFRLTGYIRDHETGLALDGAGYRLIGSGRFGTCDAEGVFQIDGLSEGTHQFFVSAAGYASARINVRLAPQDKSIEALHDFRLVPNSATGLLRIFGGPDTLPLENATIAVSTVHMPSWDDYEFITDPETMTAVTDSTGTATMSNLPAAFVTFTTQPLDTDDDGRPDFGVTSTTLDLRAPTGGVIPVVAPSYDAAAPVLVQSNIPTAYNVRLISPDLRLTFADDIDLEAIATVVQLSQNNYPRDTVPIRFEWATPTKLLISPSSALDDGLMDYDLRIDIHSNEGWHYTLIRTFYWVTGPINEPGDCAGLVTDLALVPGGAPLDFDSIVFDLSWTAVPCADGYGVYVRDDLNNPEWTLLLTNPTDFEWGQVTSQCVLPASFDRYQSDYEITPLAGTTVSFCVVPLNATVPAPGAPHAVIEIGDTTAPVIDGVYINGVSVNDSDTAIPVTFNVRFSEFISTETPDPVLTILETGGDPSYAYDPADAAWTWTDGGHTGHFTLLIPPHTDASGDEASVTFSRLIDLAGNSTGAVETGRIILMPNGGMFDFEIGDQGWTVTGDCWMWGTPRIGPLSGHDSERCFGISMSSNYSNNSRGILGSPALLVSAETAELSFYCWFDLYYGDNVYLGIKDQSGDIHPLSGYSYTNDNWNKVSYPLDEFIGQYVSVQFEFVSNASLYTTGFFVDDVEFGRR